MPGLPADGPTVPLSFANNFWGKDDAGVSPLLDRMHAAKQTCDEVRNFYNTRASIEEEYARKLLALCRKPLGQNESGTLRSSLDVARGEVESMGKAHKTIAEQMRSELEEPLAAFAGGLKERRKIVQGGIEKLLKTKQQQTGTLNKCRDKFEQDCLKIKGYLAQGHMVMGQEERKNKAKLEKTQIQMSTSETEYKASVAALEETIGRWNRDWKAACDKFQDLEEERLDFTKSSLWTFANIASTVCVTDDASCERIRLSLENCEVEKDIFSFIEDTGTGQEIPEPPRFINFCRDDADSMSEASDGDYSVAQFPRTVNPAFRTSSPQPSTLESHNDPNSDLARSMRGDEDRRSRESTVTPSKVAQQPSPNGQDYRRQAQMAAMQSDIKPIPYNEHPPEGMTMFCRTDTMPPSLNPSDVSSASSARPMSRETASDLSATSMSSIEPPTPLDDTASNVSPHKGLAKKRSGFFNNSPFRRRSKREAERPQSFAGPTARATWSTTSDNKRGGTAGHDFAVTPATSGNQDPDLEPVDPRANFQLNVGNNVFDVASPDAASRRHGKSNPANGRFANNAPEDSEDPIAAALAELKGVTKQSQARVTADRYHGLATPAPSNSSNGAAPFSNQQRMQARGGVTPPPGYTSPQPAAGGNGGASNLAAPGPAHTRAAMDAVGRQYAQRNAQVYGRGNEMPPRATSPLPMRSTSPRPGLEREDRRHHQRSHTAGAPTMGGDRANSFGSRDEKENPVRRSASPNPYGENAWRARGSQSVNTSPQKMGPPSGSQYGGQAGYGGPRHGSPNAPLNGPNDIRRAASPQPSFHSGRSGYDGRPGSSGMAVQLHNGAPPPDSGRGGSLARPTSYYGGGGPPGQGAGLNGRERSRSTAGQGGQGKQPLHFARAMYSYTAAIPEEMSFNKGDVLAVLRLQDDGWWEAEHANKKLRPGLVPSNYLQRC